MRIRTGSIRRNLYYLVQKAAADPKFEAMEIFTPQPAQLAKILSTVLTETSSIKTLCAVRSQNRLFLVSRAAVNKPYFLRHPKGMEPKTKKICNLLLQGILPKEIAKKFHCTRQYVNLVRIKYIGRQNRSLSGQPPTP